MGPIAPKVVATIGGNTRPLLGDPISTRPLTGQRIEKPAPTAPASLCPRFSDWGAASCPLPVRPCEPHGRRLGRPWQLHGRRPPPPVRLSKPRASGLPTRSDPDL